MPANPLIDPSNRLLGWSTNDLSLYGGQPTVSIGAPASAPDAGATPPADDTDNVAVAPADTDAPVAPDTIPSDAADDIQLTLAAAPPTAAPPSVVDGSYAPEVATPAGSSSQTFIPQSTGSVATNILGEERHELSDGHANNGLASVSGTTLSAIPMDQTHGSLATSVDHATAALSTITTTLGSVLDPVTNTLEGLDLLSADHGVLSLASLGGTDPVAGIVTLTSMLDSVDAFAVAPEGSGSDLFASTGPVLDLLADDVPHSLLGDVAHHEDGLLSPDHHDGGLGLL